MKLKNPKNFGHCDLKVVSESPYICVCVMYVTDVKSVCIYMYAVLCYTYIYNMFFVTNCV